MTSARATGPTVGYLTKRFPRLSETFILDEIIGLEQAGVRLRLYALADPKESVVQPGVADVRSPVVYVRRADPALTSRLLDARDLAVAQLRVALRHPRRYAATLRYVARRRRSAAALRHLLEAGVLAGLLERDGATHVHAAFAHGPASVAHFVSLLTGISFSFSAHAKDLYLSPPDLLARKVEAATSVFVCSASARDELHRIVAAHPGPAVHAAVEKIRLAPHGVDVERFRPPAGPRRAGAPRILAVGRLVPKKGYRVLLGALASLLQDGEEFTCRIVGTGPMADELRSVIERAGLGARVELVGARTQAEIAVEHRDADVFVHASVVLEDGDRDGIPNSLLEAMASGVAAVGSRVGGIPEVVRDGETGLLVDPEDPAMLATALGALLRDPALRTTLGTGARAQMVSELARRTCLAPVADALTRAGARGIGRAAMTASPAALPVLRRDTAVRGGRDTRGEVA